MDPEEMTEEEILQTTEALKAIYEALPVQSTIAMKIAEILRSDIGLKYFTGSGAAGLSATVSEERKKEIEEAEKLTEKEYYEQNQAFDVLGGVPEGYYQKQQTPDVKVKEEEYYEQNKTQEQSTGEMFIPKSWEEVPVPPEQLKTLKTDAEIEAYKKSWFQKLVFEPYIETEEGSGEYILFTQLQKWRNNEPVDTYTFAEKFEKQKELVTQIKDSEGFKEVTQKTYVEKYGEGYQVFAGTGENRRMLLDEPVSKELADEQSSQYNTSIDSAMLLTDPNTTLESFVKNSEDLDAQLLEQLEQSKAVYELELTSYFSNNYITPESEEEFDDYINKLTDGTLTMEQIKKNYQGVLLTKYPALKERIEQGYPINEIASTYVQKLGQMLEIDPVNISIEEQSIQQALQGETVKPLWEFERDIKLNDERYKYTTQARTDMALLATRLAKRFGLQ